MLGVRVRTRVTVLEKKGGLADPRFRGSVGKDLDSVYTYPDRSGYPDVSAPDKPSINTKTIEVYAIRSNTLSYLELFENDLKGGSSGCPGALRTRVHGASGYPDVTANALCSFLRLESAFFIFPHAPKNFLSLFSCPVTAQSDLP